jgi:hypothetical protein
MLSVTRKVTVAAYCDGPNCPSMFQVAAPTYGRCLLLLEKRGWVFTAGTRATCPACSLEKRRRQARFQEMVDEYL